MSKKSTARTGSEGDADSTTYTEVFTNICSGSSSCKSKRDLDGGPFGDSPPSDKNQDRFKDFLILMFQENENPTESSEGSDADQELYNLQNDYLEKLNIVRKRLNLVEISDDTDNIDQPVYSTCTITEVLDEETSNSRSGKGSQKEQHHIEQKESCSGASNNSGNLTDTYELSTIYPPSPTYNKVDSVSATNIFDLDYNPPKKKFCHRKSTPRFISTSDGQIPYYTKVGLREDLFKKEDKPSNIPKRKQNIIKRSINKFTRSKETQCTEEELGISQQAPAEETLQKQPSNTNLFPEVIIEVKEETHRGDKSISSQSSKKCATVSDHKDRDSNISPLNFIRDNSEDESYVTITTNTTIINTPKKRKKAKKRRFGGKNKINSSEKLTMWEEIRNIQSSHYPIIAGKKLGQSDISEDAAVDTGECNSTIYNIPQYIHRLSENIQLENVINSDKTDNTSQYAQQYSKYKASLEDAKLGIAYGAKVMKKVVVKDTLLQRTCHVKPKRKKNIRRFGGNSVSVPVSRRSLVTEDEIFLRLKTVRRRSNGFYFAIFQPSWGDEIY